MCGRCTPGRPASGSFLEGLSLARAALLLLVAGAPALAQGRVTSGGHLATARLDHTATLLPDGRLLVVGGRGVDGLTALASAELYQPRTGRWAPAAPLRTGRAQHTATLLPDGRVLVAGGVAVAGEGDAAAFLALASVELFSPATGRWTPGPPLAEARGNHTATLLPDGTVLVAGGTREGRGALASVEVLAPGAHAWAAAAPLPSPRWAHQAVRLGDGTSVAGWLECRDLEGGCRLSLRELGMRDLRLPEMGAPKAPAWLQWLLELR